MKPLISVLLPVYNQRPDYLRLAIESILSQTFQDFELILIDDGSTDAECLATLDYYSSQDSRIKRIINTPNIGLIESLNRGISASHGEFIARMDSDDIALPERLMTQLDFLEKNPAYALIGTSAIIINEAGEEIGLKINQTTDSCVKNTLLMTNGFTHATWMFRKNIIVEIGTYKPDAQAVEDYDLLLRLYPYHKIVNLKEPLLFHRINTQGISWSNNKFQEKQSLKIRWKYYRQGDYPYWQVILLFLPILFYLTPSTIKKHLLSLKFKRAAL